MSVETNSVTPSRSITDIVRTILKPLASLKLTVALFGFAIAIILIGTFAQVDNDIWLVMEEYFKPFWIAHVPAKVLFPRTWMPDLSEEMAGQRLAGIIAALGFLSAGLVGANGKTRTGTIFLPGLILGYSGWLAVSNWLTNGFTFPGGALIGLLMFVNLAAAHALRYRIHARGTRLWSGLGTVAAGLLLTYLIITAGHDQEGLQGEPPIPLEQLWSFVKAGLSALACAEILYAFAAKPGQRASKTLRICSGAAGIILAVVSGWLWVTGDRTYIGPSAMRIVWQLIQGAAAGVILMIGAVLLYRRKAGVVVLHLGIGLMMFGQWFVSQYDVEQQITITEGETRAYAQDIRSLELAVIDSNNSEYRGKDDVRAIPLTRNAKTTEFANGATVQLDGLPFRIEVVEFLRNSRIEQGSSENYADQIQGNGQRWHADEMKAASGVKSDSVDLAAVYVRIKDDQDKDLGVYLLSQSQLFMRGGAELSFDAQRFDVAGQSYDIQLRFKRLYKPYEIKLIDVAKKDYLGTTMARAYESTISINGETDVRKIWMNNPLRFSGETFYQTNYFMDPFTGQETSTLQVVKNHGWMIPYVSCMISIIGMTYHFILTLANYKPVSTVSDVQLTSAQKWIVPVVFALLAAGMYYKVASPKKLEPAAMDLAAAGRLPVIYQGRIKPWDTLARNNLRVLSERETFSGQLTDAQLLAAWPEIKEQISQKWSTLSDADLDGAVQQPATGEKYVDVAKLVELVTQKVDKPILEVESAVHKLTHDRQPAIRWLLDMINDANQWQQHRVIRITDLEVLELLGMERRKGYRYSISEIAPQLEAFDAAVKEARAKDTAELSHYEKKLMDLAQKLQQIQKLKIAFQPQVFPPQITSPDQMKTSEGMAQLNAFRQQLAQQEQEFKQLQPPLVVAPSENPLLPTGNEWQAYSLAWPMQRLLSDFGMELNPSFASVNSILVYYAQNKPDEFNQSVRDYQTFLDGSNVEELQASPSAMSRFVAKNFGGFLSFETFFNRSAPFLWSMWLDLFAFVLIATGLLVGLGSAGWGQSLRRSGYAVLVVTAVVHTLALIARIYISGRPPVTNLYSSAVFIGWAIVLGGLIFEYFYPTWPSILASISGFCTLMIAHFLAGDGDTFEVLVAVLDTQFWLATHVVCITLGYATTFLAGAVGILFILMGVISPKLNQKTAKCLYQMMYGITCFSILFSFFGTVLGGLWADDSWGRFWGWDPKENGALIIVLWNAILLHSRWGGMVRDRGFAILAVGGNIVTAWSWFGVNELGAGLHSYGFTEGVLRWLMYAAGTFLTIMIVGSIPTEFWWSYRRRSAESESSTTN